MEDIKNLEHQYLKAKIAYYEGNPVMSDAVFDELEQRLKRAGSRVIEQVGSKRKDFDFPHPTRMLSLAKIQTERTPTGTEYQAAEFKKWHDKRALESGIAKRLPYLSISPKFDGSAINVIYKGGRFFQILTRGDGLTGKDVTQRLSPLFPDKLKTTKLEIKPETVIEIRCEVVCARSIFDQKYTQYANPRNFVAGAIGRDDHDESVIADFTVIPLHFLVDGKHTGAHHFESSGLATKEKMLFPEEYTQKVALYEKNRDSIDYPLDGVVISFDAEYRAELGENDHDPEWAIAIKFVPDEVITSYVGIEWNVGKTGELAPVILLEPVQLAGTTVKRASGYNAGYIVNNKVGPGAMFSVAKAGEIIPEVQKVEVEATNPVQLPTSCPACSSKLDFDGIHLTCTNLTCKGKMAKKLATSGGIIDLKRVGSKTLEAFAEDFHNMVDLIYWVVTEGHTGKIIKYGITPDSRSHEIFYEAFTNIKSLDYEQVVRLMGYDNVGRKLSLQVAREHAGLDADYSGLERALVTMLQTPKVRAQIKSAVEKLEELDIVIHRPADQKRVDALYVCLTGSPKGFGYKTKEEFLNKFPHMVEVSLTDKNCNCLVTDSMSSTSSKMKTAEKKGIQIKTYGDF